LSLGNKIIVSFVFLSVLLGGLGILWEIYYEQITNQQLKESKEASQLVQYTNEMEISLYQSLLNLNSIREASQETEIDNSAQIKPSVSLLTNNYKEEVRKFTSSFGSFELLIDTENSLRDEVVELQNLFLLYTSLSNEWLGLLKEDVRLANEMFISSIEPYFRAQIMPKVSEMRKKATTRQEHKIQLLNEKLSRARIVNLLGTMFVVIIGILLALYIYRSIATPLHHLNNAASNLGSGNLSYRIKSISNDEFGDLALAFNKMAQNLESKTISTEYLDNVIESIQSAIFVADVEGVITNSNSSAANILGYTKVELLGELLTDFISTTDLNIDPENGEFDSNGQKEFKLITSKGENIPVMFSEADLIENGVKVGTVRVASDIRELKSIENELKKALREKELMLAEIHHRVKNNLAVISGLLQLQSFQSDNEDVSKALIDSQHRIRSIALVHEMLYQSESLAYIDYGAYVKDLVGIIKSMYLSKQKNIELVTEIEPFSLDINQAISCSLLINEVLVNAFKHAFTNQNEGKISVTGGVVDDMVTLRISDDGKGVDQVEFYEASSLGATLIKTLTSQLNGSFEVQDQPDGRGSMFVVRFKKESTV